MRSVLFSLFLTLALAGAAAGLAFLAGRSSADAAGHFERGVAQGERLAEMAVRAEVGPGSAAYRAALDRARTDGFAEGRRAGRAAATRPARRDPALAEFKGGWEVGWYLVAVSPSGDADNDLRMVARMRVRRGVRYGLCAGVSRICQTAARVIRAR